MQHALKHVERPGGSHEGVGTGKKTMGYPWLTTTQSGYLCCKHAGASMGREAVGGGYNNLFKCFLFVCSCCFTLIVVW